MSLIDMRATDSLGHVFCIVESAIDGRQYCFSDLGELMTSFEA